MSTWVRPGDELSRLSARMLMPLGDIADRAALAGSFVDGCAAASANTAQRHAFRTIGIAYGTAAAAASAFGNPSVFSDPSIGTQRSTLEPRLVEELARLHVKTYRHKTGLTESVVRRAATVAATEVAHDAIVRHPNSTAVAVAIMIAVLRRGQRGESD